MSNDSKAVAGIVLEAVSKFASARTRPMMGGYLLYVGEKLVGQINEGELFVKVTPFGERFAPEPPKEPPYPGAKPAFRVPQEWLGQESRLEEFITGTRADLA